MQGLPDVAAQKAPPAPPQQLQQPQQPHRPSPAECLALWRRLGPHAAALAAPQQAAGGRLSEDVAEALEGAFQGQLEVRSGTTNA